MRFLKKFRSLRKISLRESSTQVKIKDFDEQFYLEHNPDVAKANVNAYEHYVKYGKAEGRCPTPVVTDAGCLPFDTNKETILLVCHQASRTGAPILGLNLCQLLNNRYNVIILLLAKGEIFSFFKKNCFKVILFSEISLATPNRIDTIIRALATEYKIEFALINSIVSASVLKSLAHHFIPSVLLIHEFFSYIRPINSFNEALFWSSANVFPTKMLQSNGRTEVTQNTISASHVLPQGKSYIPFDKTQETYKGNIQLKNILDKWNESEVKPFVILGAGTVEYRKGVDLFITTASELKRMHPTANIKFYWVGHGFNPIHDAGYSCYLSYHIQSTELFTHFEFIPSVSDLEPLYEITDLFYMPARLDPLPNVVIDAMMLGIPILCFEQGCGACEFLDQDLTTKDCILPYLSVNSAVEAIIKLYQSKPEYDLLSQKISAMAPIYFDMQRYTDEIIKIGQSQQTLTKQEQLACQLLENLVHLHPTNKLYPLNCSESIRRYIRSWYSQIYPLRRPTPGFNPYIYNSHCLPEIEPFTDYLHNGAQNGPWKNDLIVAEHNIQIDAAFTPVAIHIHMPEPQDLSDILNRISKFSGQYDIFVSTEARNQPHIEHLLYANKANNCYITTVSEETPALHALFLNFGSKLTTYELIAHLRSLRPLSEHHVIDHRARQLFFLEHMIGGEYLFMDQIIREFKRTPSLGMVFPDDPYLWMSNLAQPSFDGIKAGMFWARTNAIAPLFSSKQVEYEDLLATVKEQQFSYATTYIADITY